MINSTKDIRKFRLLAVLSAFLYASFGFMNTLLLQSESNSFFFERLIFSGLLISSFIFSYTSEQVKKRYYYVLCALIYVAITHLGYISWYYGYTFSNTVGVLITLIFTSLFFYRTRHVRSFLIYSFLYLGTSAALSSPSDVSVYTFIPLLFTMEALIFVTLSYRFTNEKMIKINFLNLQSLIDNTEDLIWSLDRHLNYISFNNAYVAAVNRMANKTPEIGNEFISSHLKLNGLDQIIKQFYSEILSGEKLKLEETIYFPEQTSYYRVSFSAMINEHQKIIGISCYAHDITQLKANENELRRMEEETAHYSLFQKSVLDSTQQAIITADIHGIINQFNKGAERLLGYSAEELIGKQTPGIFHLPEEVVARAKVLTEELGFNVTPDFQTYIAKAKIAGNDRNEWTFVTKKGTRIDVDLTVTPISEENGNIVGYTGVVSDITQNKKDLKEITLLKNALDETSLVSITDEKGVILSVNDKFCEVSKYSREELIGKNYRILNSGEHSTEFFKSLWETISQGTIWKGEIKNKDKHGHYFWLDTTIVPIVDEAGNPTQFISFRHDITKRKIFEMELIASKELAQHLSQAKNQFLASMSHEIRTPLNGILGFTRLLLDNPDLTAEQKLQLSSIKTSGDILLVIINDILDLAKFDAGKLKIESIKFDLGTLVQDIVRTYSAKIDEKQIKVGIDLSENISKLLLGDPIRISQILLNLLSNAVKFTPEAGKIEIKLLVIDDNSEKQTVEISVHDNGIGISEDKLPLIFNPFEQSETNTYRKYGGTGLGLTIVQKLVELMHGSIDVESQLGKGSTFIIRIPLLKLTENALQEQENEPRKIDIHKLQDVRILVAEDNNINQLLIKTELTKIGLSIALVENGLRAVEEVKKGIFDIVLMDLMMPEMDGYQATMEIRKLTSSNSDIPIIALTADISSDVTNKCHEVGINDYISKPFQPEDLIQKIVKYTQTKE